MICYLNKKFLSVLNFVRVKKEYPYLVLGQRHNSFFLPENLIPFEMDIFSDSDYMDFFENISFSINHIGFLLTKLPEKPPLHLGGNLIIVDSFNLYQCYYTDIEGTKTYFKEIELLMGEDRNDLHH